MTSLLLKIAKYLGWPNIILKSSIRHDFKTFLDDKISVLLSETNYLGDAVLDLPLIDSLKNNSHIKYIGAITSPSSNDIFCKYLGNDSCYMLQRSSCFSNISDQISLLKWIRANKFNVAICLDRNSRGLVRSFVSGIPVRIGFKVTAPYSPLRKYNFLYTDSIDCKDGLKHRSEQNIDLPNLIGLHGDHIFHGILLHESNFLYAKQLFSKNNISNNDIVIVIHIGGRIPPKIWPPERWAQLIDCFLNAIGVRIILVAGPDDTMQLDNITSRLKFNTISIIQSPNLFDLAAVAAKSNLFIGADSGPLHLAAASGARCLGLYTYASPITFKPLGSKTDIIRSPFLCDPCFKEMCKKNLCMQRISLDEVRKLALQIIGLQTKDIFNRI